MSDKPDVSREEMLEYMDDGIEALKNCVEQYGGDLECPDNFAKHLEIAEAIRSHLSTSNVSGKKMLKDFEHIEGIYRDQLIREGLKPHEIGFRLKDLFDPIHSVLAHLSTPERPPDSEYEKVIVLLQKDLAMTREFLANAKQRLGVT